jgi:general secretion pathway protein D
MNRREVSPAPFRAVFRVALFAVLAVFGLSSAGLRAESANSLYKHGQSAEAREDYDTAFNDFQQAYKKSPKDLSIRTALYRVRVTASAVHVTKGLKLFDAGNDAEAIAEFLHAAEIDPGNQAAQQALARVRQKHGEVTPAGDAGLPRDESQTQDLDTMGAPAELRPISNDPVTLHMSEDTKVIYQAVGKAAGVNILFDPDFQSKRIQVDLNNVSLTDALRIVGTISNTFWRPVTSNTIFVAQNTRAKRTELDEQAVQTFYLTNASKEADVTDVSTAIRNVLSNAKAYPVPSQNAIVIRGTPDELLLAQKLVDDLDKSRPEVVVDVSIMEVSKNFEKTLGIQWPSSAGVALSTSTSSTTSTDANCATDGTGCNTSSSNNLTLYNLAHLNASDFAVTVGSATANLLLTDSNTKILQNPRIRATDQQKATMKIGEKIPIATGSYQTGAATAVVSSLVNTQFQYQDVGVNIEVTPTVHYDRDVTLKIVIEVTSQTGSVTISGVTEPILSQRKIDQVIRLREGEASILGGINDSQDQSSWSGIPGLSSIPLLKYLFGSKDHTVTDDELVFLVVPHVVRSQTLDKLNLRTVDTGTGQNVELRHIASDGTGSNPGWNPGPRHSSPGGRSEIGTVPGQSAAAAAPAALAQMRQLADANGNNVAAQPSAVTFVMAPQPGPVASGATFQVPITLSGGTDIAAVPLQISYDPAKLSLVNVDSGDFLAKDGQAVALVHRDDGPGSISVNVSRPPGTSGISGSGVVCLLTFQARTAGESSISITHPGAVNSLQQQLPAQSAQVSIRVQ